MYFYWELETFRRNFPQKNLRIIPPYFLIEFYSASIQVQVFRININFVIRVFLIRKQKQKQKYLSFVDLISRSRSLKCLTVGRNVINLRQMEGKKERKNSGKYRSEKPYKDASCPESTRFRDLVARLNFPQPSLAFAIKFPSKCHASLVQDL